MHFQITMINVKKFLYFSPSNEKLKMQEWIEAIRDIRSYKKKKLDFNKTALLVLDMQNVFLKENSHAFIPSATTIIPKIESLIKIFMDNKKLVLYTRHISVESNNYFPNSMDRWWRNSITKSDSLSNIYEDFKPKSNQIIIKSQYSAFFNTQLHELLHKNRINQLIITGVMTHLCCESTARDGFMHGYDIWFPIDTTASYIEDFHIGTLKAIHHGIGECLTSKNIIQMIREA